MIFELSISVLFFNCRRRALGVNPGLFLFIISKNIRIFTHNLKQLNMAKKVTKTADGANTFEDALERLNKQYGKGTVLSLGSKSEGTYDAISTGSIGFDWKTLGVGGFVKGKMYELMGWEGTGKSTICGHAVASCQSNGGKVVYIDGEHAVDTNYFNSLGVDTDTMMIAQPSCGEEGFNIAVELMQTGDVDLIIIDSDSSLIPKAVLDGAVGEHAIGKKARLNSSAYPKIKSMAHNTKTCVIIVSQYREKIGVMFGNPTTTQGGHALKFYSDVRIEVSKSLAKEAGEVYGNITKVRAIKNKMNPPYVLSDFEVLYGVGIDKVGEMMQLLNDYELGRKYGKTMTVDGVKHDLEEFKDMVRNDEIFYNDLKHKIISAIKGVEEVEEEESPIMEITDTIKEGGVVSPTELTAGLFDLPDEL
jgi:recombination protein RecA|tara:strand:- start:1460 stop:2713 length:1254 start_codon:yes stop_codon:yes gene_type:complete